MTPEDEQRITRWIDGELDDGEVADLLEAHPELADEKIEAGALGDLLRTELGPDREADVPYADFFSHRVHQRIAEGDLGEDESDASDGVGLREEAQILPLFTRLRFAAGLAFVLMLVSIVGYAMFTSSPPAFGSEVVSTYTPDPSVTATTRYSSEAEATIIELDGLAEVPAEKEIAGVSPNSHQPTADSSRTVLTDSSDGHPLLALAIDADGRPEFTVLHF